MGETFQVRLEPVGIEFEVDEDETVLRGAFRQGLMLMHGCKEGQCAACKSFLLDGEVDLDKYSTFALNDFEKEEGWTLLCRAHAVSDLEVELINYDEEVLRSGVALQTQSMRVEAIEELTHDIRRLVSAVMTLDFQAGPVRRHHDPGHGRRPLLLHGESPRQRPAGVHDQDLSRRQVLEPARRGAAQARGRGPGHRPLRGVHPAGEIRAPVAVHRRRGGMAPILALLRSMAEKGNERPAVYYYGARGPATCFTSTSWPSSSALCPTSASSRPCRTATRTRTGTVSGA